MRRVFSGWEIVLLFIRLCICVFHIFGGHFIVNHLEINVSPAGFIRLFVARSLSQVIGRTQPGFGEKGNGQPSGRGGLALISHLPHKAVVSKEIYFFIGSI